MCARAALIALMAASVPELTNRTRSIDSNASSTRRAMRFSNSVGAPKLVPFPAAALTAPITEGWAWPRIIGPHEHT